MARRKPVYVDLSNMEPPSLTDRYNSASALATQARGAFLIASLDLEDSARDLDAVLVDVDSQIGELIELRAHVEYDRDSFLESAKRLKALVEPNEQLSLF